MYCPRDVFRLERLIRKGGKSKKARASPLLEKVRVSLWQTYLPCPACSSYKGSCFSASTIWTVPDLFCRYCRSHACCPPPPQPLPCQKASSCTVRETPPLLKLERQNLNEDRRSGITGSKQRSERDKQAVCLLLCLISD